MNIVLSTFMKIMPVTMATSSIIPAIVLISLSLLPFLFREIKVGLPYYALAAVLDAYLLYSVLLFNNMV